jgi:hypothetical protein
MFEFRNLASASLILRGPCIHIGGRLIKRLHSNQQNLQQCNRTASAAHTFVRRLKILPNHRRSFAPSVPEFHTPLVQSKATFGRLKQFAEEFYRLHESVV